MFKKTLSLVLAAALAAPLAAMGGPSVSAKPEGGGKGSAPSGQGYSWDRVKVVGGGFVPGIVFNPSEKDLIYARTDIGGAYRWDPALKKWKQLLDFVGAKEWNMLGVDALATDPVETNRLYVAAGMYTNDFTDMNGVLLRSTDKGETWQRTELPFKLGGNMPGRSMGERLAIDPNDNRILYMGTRSGNGLWRSTDYGATWQKVESFTAVGNVRDPYNDLVGVVWVTFDPSTGSRGKATRTIYAGVADTEHSLYRSTDGGQTWEPVPGQPAQGFIPHHGILSANGNLYVTYTKEVGPYNGGEGSVWKYETVSGKWTDISPTGAGKTDSPYGGLAVDAQHPDTVMVATMNKWWPDEFIYRSTDGGKTWKPFWTLDDAKDPVRTNQYTIDYSLAPWLDWGEKKNLPEQNPKLGWMIGDLEIDPFDPDRIMYGTGATLYGSNNVTALDKGQNVNISVMADGIEETAVMGLISPPSGAHLLSAMGDIGGFRHEDLNQAPPMITNPYLGTSTDIDYAELNPNIVVRVGNSEGSNPRMGVSMDNGKTWRPAANAWVSPSNDATQGGYVAVGADGSSMVWSPSNAADPKPVSYSKDLGATWKASSGIPSGARVSSDRVNPKKFYGIADGVFYVSVDGGATFAKAATGLPTYLTSNFKAMPGVEGDIWVAAAEDNTDRDSPYGLWHSTDSGKTFKKLDQVQAAAAIGFGKAAPGQSYMALYAHASIGGRDGIYRSDDAGRTWIRINDDRHQFGAANTAITGDPRVYGRVYLATNGLGIVLGEMAGTPGTAAPVITVDGKNKKQNNRNYVLSGHVSKPVADARISVRLNGGEPMYLKVNNGKFNGKLTLASGTNRIVLEAVDSDGNKASVEMTVEYNAKK